MMPTERIRSAPSSMAADLGSGAADPVGSILDGSRSGLRGSGSGWPTPAAPRRGLPRYVCAAAEVVGPVAACSAPSSLSRASTPTLSCAPTTTLPISVVCSIDCSISMLMSRKEAKAPFRPATLHCLHANMDAPW
ncbi:hypothetical protein BDA96_01G116600 [Sorghum bicolor]|uniref:Uncharacterized protein n=2 Tax=Sorghum bicolor TaxID=4558 RepID=A0A921RXA1_SORBI|nr:hypothetical protein BDA96_01G116600 [Sorghum bicolor]KXG37703.1 hypothetical protein SORBI_3001G111900 [Sorghum bicolor]